MNLNLNDIKKKFDQKNITEEFPKIRAHAIYIVGGGFILANFYYAFCGFIGMYSKKMFQLLEYISQDIFKMIIFASVAYVTGFLAVTLVGIIPMPRKRHLMQSLVLGLTYRSHLFLGNLYKKERYKEKHDELENTYNIQHVITTSGASFFISAIILFLSFVIHWELSDLLLMFILFFLSLICEYQQRHSDKHAWKLHYSILVDAYEHGEELGLEHDYETMNEMIELLISKNKIESDGEHERKNGKKKKS